MKNNILIVLPLFNQGVFLQAAIPYLEQIDFADILIVDDGSTDETDDLLDECSWIKAVKVDNSIGIGAVVTVAFEYARDYEYDTMILIDSSSNEYFLVVDSILEHIKYGYDVISASRILENYDYTNFATETIKVFEAVAGAVNNETSFNITDPLSSTMAININAMKYFELTENDHSVFLQIWIQAAHFGLTVLEIPASCDKGFGSELELYEDPLGRFLSFIETEKELYKKDTSH